MSEIPDRKPRAKKRGGLFVTDAELLERMGLPENLGYQALKMLDEDKHSAFPKKDPFWGGRRYWPAVEAYLDETQGLPRKGTPVRRHG